MISWPLQTMMCVGQRAAESVRAVLHWFRRGEGMVHRSRPPEEPTDLTPATVASSAGSALGQRPRQCPRIGVNQAQPVGDLDARPRPAVPATICFQTGREECNRRVGPIYMVGQSVRSASVRFWPPDRPASSSVTNVGQSAVAALLSPVCQPSACAAAATPARHHHHAATVPGRLKMWCRRNPDAFGEPARTAGRVRHAESAHRFVSRPRDGRRESGSLSAPHSSVRNFLGDRDDVSASTSSSPSGWVNSGWRVSASPSSR